jgi:hypothetical protein
MQPVSKKKTIGKHASTTVEIVRMVFSIRSAQIGYIEEIWGNQFSLGLAVQLSSTREAEKRLIRNKASK